MQGNLISLGVSVISAHIVHFSSLHLVKRSLFTSVIGFRMKPYLIQVKFSVPPQDNAAVKVVVVLFQL